MNFVYLYRLQSKSFGFSEWHFSTLFDASLLKLKATFYVAFFWPRYCFVSSETICTLDIDRKWRTRHDRPAWWVKFSRFE